MKYTHSYDTTNCPSCGNDLTKPDGVTIIYGVETEENLINSHLSADGVLEDTGEGIVDTGLHKSTGCGKCHNSLDDNEIV